MEGRPRFGQEQPDDSDSKESNSKKKRRDRAALGLGRYIDRTVAGDSATERSGGSWLSPLYERVARKKDARILLPPVESVADTADKPDTDDSRPESTTVDASEAHAAEGELPTVIDSPEDGTNGDHEVLEDFGSEVLESMSEQQPEDDARLDDLPIIPAWPVLERPVAPTAGDRHHGVPNIELFDSRVDNEDDAPLMDGSETVPVDDEVVTQPEAEAQTPNQEPESLEEILRRRTMQGPAETIHGDEPETVARRTANAPVGSERTVENHYYTNPNTGLHLLNYALARRRDSHNRKDANNKIAQSNRRISDLETAQKEQDSVIELLTKQQKEQNKVPNSATVFERGQDVNPSKVVNATMNPEVLFERHHTETVDTKNADLGSGIEAKTNEYARGSRLDILPAIEAPDTYSEMQFDRRHEVMDAPGETATRPLQQDDGHGVDNAVMSTEAQSRIVPDDASRSGLYNKDGGDMKDMVVTSAWGVIAGILVFIAIYITTH